MGWVARRRWSARRAVALSLCLAVLASACFGPDDETPAAEVVPTGLPNVLIVLTDDQAVDSLAPMPKTRRWLKRGGVSFSQAFATTPYCCPSRATIATGRYTHNHENLRDIPRNPDALGDHSTLMEHQLRNLGYRTAFFGKYLNGWDLKKDPPHFDKWAIFSYSSPDGYRGGRWNVQGTERTVDTYSTTYLRQKAARFIKNQAGPNPWLMYVSTAAPHLPLEPEAKYRNAPVGGWKRWKRANPSVAARSSAGKHPAVKKKARSTSEGRRMRQGQLRTLMSVDDLVGGVRDALRETKQERNTLVIYLSDNGFMWGEHGLVKKMVPYTRSVKVPLLMRWPAGGVVGGRTDRRLVGTIDVAPTVYDAVGLPLPLEVDGRSLINRDWRRKRLLFEYWMLHGWPSWASIRTKRYQYVEWYEGAGQGEVTFREYYDLSKDPHQMTNLLANKKTRSRVDVKALSRRLARDRSCAGESCP